MKMSGLSPWEIFIVWLICGLGGYLLWQKGIELFIDNDGSWGGSLAVVGFLLIFLGIPIIFASDISSYNYLAYLVLSITAVIGMVMSGLTLTKAIESKKWKAVFIVIGGILTLVLWPFGLLSL